MVTPRHAGVWTCTVVSGVRVLHIICPIASRADILTPLLWSSHIFAVYTVNGYNKQSKAPMTGKKKTASKSKHECKRNISFANVLRGGDCVKTRHTNGFNVNITSFFYLQEDCNFQDFQLMQE